VFLRNLSIQVRASFICLLCLLGARPAVGLVQAGRAGPPHPTPDSVQARCAGFCF
jgi:hypothetical protein